MLSKITVERHGTLVGNDFQEVLNTTVLLRVETTCECVKKLVQALNGAKASEVLKPFSHNPVYILAGKYLKHPSCPVPAAILKAAEVELGLAKARGARIEFTS